MTEPEQTPHRTVLPSVYQWATSPLHSIQETARSGVLLWLPRQLLIPTCRWFAINTLRAGPVPTHVAFIMDGNRRFAKKRHVAKLAGHSAGFDKLKQVRHSIIGHGCLVPPQQPPTAPSAAYRPSSGAWT